MLMKCDARAPRASAARPYCALAQMAKSYLVSEAVIERVSRLIDREVLQALLRGVQGLAVRTAKAINRVLGRRGRVWFDRYHAHVLRTPREVRNALVYILNNARKHLPGIRGLDPRSSARFFAHVYGLPGMTGRRSLMMTPAIITHWLFAWRQRPSTPTKQAS